MALPTSAPRLSSSCSLASLTPAPQRRRSLLGRLDELRPADLATALYALAYFNTAPGRVSEYSGRGGVCALIGCGVAQRMWASVRVWEGEGLSLEAGGRAKRHDAHTPRCAIRHVGPQVRRRHRLMSRRRRHLD